MLKLERRQNVKKCVWRKIEIREKLKTKGEENLAEKKKRKKTRPNFTLFPWYELFFFFRRTLV